MRAWLLATMFAAAGAIAAAAPDPPRVVTLQVADIVGPASADFIVRGIDTAEREGAALVVLELDTPGGLDVSMRQIIKAILASTVPVATYVSPPGARAASAGTFILYASHIAAMAPATNLGAATPVSIGGGKEGSKDGGKDGGKDQAPDAMTSKVTNDAVAYIRSLAELRGRDVAFAERAVRDAASISASDALAQHVIDIIADDLPDLLRQLNGREVAVAQRVVTLNTAQAVVESVTPDWRSRLLGVIANPQLALVFMMIGTYALFYEFTSPGFGVPGVAGAILLMLALFAFQMLSISWTGVALLGLGALLVMAEAFLPSFGVLGIGGIVAMVLGGVFLFDSGMPGVRIPLSFSIGLGLVTAAALYLTGGVVKRMRSRPIVSGREMLIDAVGTVTVVDADGAFARIQGESWRINSPTPVRVGDRVKVVRADSLTLDVTPVP